MIKNIKSRFVLVLILSMLSACSQNHSTNSSNKHGYIQSNVQGHLQSNEKGKASYYADKYQGRQTANGERFKQNARTAAHKTLTFGTWVKVTNLKNGRSVVVRINDRGPFVKGRIIDLSKSAFSSISNVRLGVVDVVVEILR